MDRRAAVSGYPTRLVGGTGLLILTVLTMAACHTSTPGAGTPSTGSTPQGSTRPGPAPTEPVTPNAVAQKYRATLAAAVQAAGSAFRWQEPPTQAVITMFAGTCVVALEQSGTGVLPGDLSALQHALDEALHPHGFGRAYSVNDPGGAWTLVAVDSAGAQFEFRSKGATTVAVRVPAASSQC